MILVNGSIKVKIKTGGGFDEDGNPVNPSATWGKNIPCRFKPNRNSLKGKTSGNTFIVASYEILIDLQDLQSESIKLFDIEGNEVDEYQVMWIEQLDAVEATKITV